MSLEQLSIAIFEQIGDVFVIELSPVTNVASFTGYEEDVVGVTGTRTFSREFSYSLNNQPATNWTALTNPNLAAIVVADPADVYVFRFKYTRTGADATGELVIDMFRLILELEDACIVLYTNKENWDILHGTYKFIQISEQVEKFNKWVVEHMTPDHIVRLIDDTSVGDTMIYLKKLGGCDDKDINVVMKMLWGNYLVDYQHKIGINMYDGIQTQ